MGDTTHRMARPSSRKMGAKGWLALCVAASGVVNLLEGLLPKSFDVLNWMANHLPFPVSERSRMLLLFAGVLQLALSRGLGRGKRAAWALCLGILLVTPLLHLGRALDWHHAVIQAGLAVALLVWRREFVARSDGASVRWALVIGVCAVFLVMVFGVVAVRHYAGEMRGPQDVAASAETIWALAFGQEPVDVLPLTARAETVFEVIGEVSLGFCLLVIFLLLRPMLQRSPQTGDERARAAEVIARYGVDSFDVFALLPDKRYHFSGEGEQTCLTSYVLWRDVAVTLSSPVGPAEAVPAAIREFDAFCHRQDWYPVFYEVPAGQVEAYEAAGLRTFHVAEEARIDLKTFALTGGRFQNLRSAQNKLKKTGWSCEGFFGGALPDDLLTELTVISDEWLAARHGVEMTFDLGAFGPDSLNAADVFVLFDENKKPVAFATWLPYAQNTSRTLDLMRHGATVSGGMDGLIVESLLEFQRRGLSEASLGSAPLANLEDRARDMTEDKALRYLFEHFSHVYGYKSLFEFKKKYQPVWVGRHVAYRHISQVLLAATAIARVHLPNGVLKYLRS